MAKTETPIVHQVLYIGHLGAEGEFVKGHPLLSREEGDPNAEDDFFSLKHEHLAHARKSGAVRPEFRVIHEQKGLEV